MYSVEWSLVGENQLASVWLTAPDRVAVSRSAANIDHHLKRRPLLMGESRSSSVERVVFDAPLAVEYTVIEDDKKVIVQSVWWWERDG
jgi:hypothetical protein